MSTMVTAVASHILPLAEAFESTRCGGKAANLARLMQSGAPVPDGIVLTRAAFEGGPFDAAFVHSHIPDTAVLIVRSSAVGEDSADASFAGQLDSIAGVTSVTELRNAIDRVWASQRSDRVLAYQAARGIALAGMGVIVQRQVAASVSGVLFTVSPTDPTKMLLEYCGGMGEALVSGAVNPGRVLIERQSDHGWRQTASPDDPAHEESLLLNDARMAELARLALDIEQTFGAPQDIEWTIDGEGKLWIVQSRPITAGGQTGVRPGSDSGQTGVRPGSDSCVHWSNANVNENFPEPISPLLYSIARLGYYHYFRNLGRAFGVSAARLALMEPALRQIIGVHGARMYYNLTGIHSVLRSVPFGDLLAGSFNQFVGAEDTGATRVGPAYRLKQALELVVIAAKTTWQYVFLTRRVERFEATVDRYAATTHPSRLAGKPLAALLADFRAFLDIRCNRWNNAALADAGAMICYGVLQRLLARAFPGRDQQALHNSLLKALPNLVSGVPPLKLWDLSRMIRADKDLRVLVENAAAAEVLDQVRTNPQFCEFRTALDDFLEHWGFRCSGELMLTVPSFQEDATPVINLLKSYVAMDAESPRDILARQERERISETRAVLATLRPAFIVRTVLAWTQRCIQLRERARLKQALLYSRLRRLTLTMGARLAAAGLVVNPDDVFFLTAEELELLAAGGAMFPHHVKPMVALRRDAHRDLSRTTPPDSMELGEGEYFKACDVATLQQSPVPHGRELSGVGACGGATTARAAILLDVTESHKLSAGDVLVTKQTDPGWGPIFPLISGLVIERGGMLSHGAIIAREFGIPSVVGVKDATRLIVHGSSITVDGDRGVVHIAGATAS